MSNDTFPTVMPNSIGEMAKGISAAESDTGVEHRVGGSLKPVQDIYPQRLIPYMMMDRMRPLISIEKMEYFVKEYMKMRKASDILNRRKEREQNRKSKRESKNISHNKPRAVTKRGVKVTKAVQAKGLKKASTSGSNAKKTKQLAILKNIKE